ncbi:uracil DNA glycosylase [Coccidioides posadasii str. Silveira]|uniref:Uracil-DNA glycosylase n=3 Tax=Coccidioides posadasii TaxID=199306 RepID=E9D0H7_COCPS|nr:uracil-DNA glycosylase, putative [Coccidioides posadasii C735 delta SOWgp]EER26017.1 uracil-DNA glycosylase, putative [Coccidioides posadasii C735 delta SOWgp]EFW19831.1 uracil-DNA glycosylase [Coccidioides posadasii str. Silveira]KMM73602.1 uracil-DNA glycosylase [Coccidioides posadasii RMSCC 3488]QVM08995.1 uracil DNA glycosylase [Coccidioides posadasii str. Silveira]|eukprot:XP_003068162.1 uracil-DNA glycosylase, putative [Coccidioides posadasii C735 delta SOWgp]
MSLSNSLKRNASHLSTVSVNTKKSKSNGTITSFFGAPTSKSTNDPVSGNTTSGPVTSKFCKEKWVASLTSEQRELLKLEIDTLEESWLAQLKEELLTKDFLNLKRFLRKEVASGAEIFPPLNDVYSWSRHTPLHKVKAVIIGQDPYHGYGQAHGLCFSVRPPTPAPPSLKNIYIALKKDYPSFQPPPNGGGLLTPWADRGVLMLNTCLTVRARSPNSHSRQGWERFTQKAIDVVARVRSRGVVFLAWGRPAANRVANVNREKHCVLQSVHPSPLSAHNGFFNCGHFKKANQWLEKRYGPEGGIDWSLTQSTAANKESNDNKQCAGATPETDLCPPRTKETQEA